MSQGAGTLTLHAQVESPSAAPLIVIILSDVGLSDSNFGQRKRTICRRVAPHTAHRAHRTEHNEKKKTTTVALQRRRVRHPLIDLALHKQQKFSTFQYREQQLMGDSDV